MKKLFLLFLFLSGCQAQPLYKDTQLLIGTFVEVTSPDKMAAGVVFSEIKRMELLLSKYKPESEISKLNASGKIKASPEVFYVVKKAKELSEIADSAFDITVGPLMDLWGFSDKNYRLPSEAEIKSALKRVGSDKIILDEAQSMIQFSVAAMKVDLGAIAKGYILDCAVAKLKASGIASCLINAGGQVIALGDKFGKPWRVAIRNPRQGQFAGYLELKDRSVSTSGDYEQYFILEGRRYSHIMNPKTGYPVETKIESVTVVADTGLVADALSTSIFALGSRKGEELAGRYFPGTEIKIIEGKDAPGIK